MSNLTKRIITALIILPPILALLFMGNPIHIAAFAIILAGMAGFEFASISLEKNQYLQKFLTSSLSAIFAMALALSVKNITISISVIITVAPICFLMFMFGSDNNKKLFYSTASSLTGIIYTGGLFGALALIPLKNIDNGKYWILLLLSSVILNDTFAYTTGRLFGKHKLNKTISPNKTWEGSFGGIIGSLVAAITVKELFLQNIPILHIIIFGIILGVGGQVGDLMESFVKRSFDVKDSGKILPGHGGILDRMDSLMLGAPIVLLFSTLI